MRGRSWGAAPKDGLRLAADSGTPRASISVSWPLEGLADSVRQLKMKSRFYTTYSPSGVKITTWGRSSVKSTFLPQGNLLGTPGLVLEAAQILIGWAASQSVQQTHLQGDEESGETLDVLQQCPPRGYLLLSCRPRGPWQSEHECGSTTSRLLPSISRSSFAPSHSFIVHKVMCISTNVAFKKKTK